MNLLQQLEAINAPRSKVTHRRVTPEQRRVLTSTAHMENLAKAKEKSILARRLDRNMRWKAAFDGEELTTSQLAARLGYSKTVVTNQMRKMCAEVPPVAELVRKVPGARGNEQYVFRWIGE